MRQVGKRTLAVAMMLCVMMVLLAGCGGQKSTRFVLAPKNANPTEQELGWMQNLLSVRFKEGYPAAAVEVAEGKLVLTIPGEHDETLLEGKIPTGQLVLRMPTGEVIMTGAEVTGAVYYYYETIETETVVLYFTTAGRIAFKKATETISAYDDEDMRIVSVCIDGTEISRAIVDEVVDADSCVIAADWSREQAEAMAAQLVPMCNAPFGLQLESTEMVTV